MRRLSVREKQFFIFIEIHFELLLTSLPLQFPSARRVLFEVWNFKRYVFIV